MSRITHVSMDTLSSSAPQSPRSSRSARNGASKELTSAPTHVGARFDGDQEKNGEEDGHITGGFPSCHFRLLMESFWLSSLLDRVFEQREIEMGSGTRAIHFLCFFFLASKAPSWTRRPRLHLLWSENFQTFF